MKSKKTPHGVAKTQRKPRYEIYIDYPRNNEVITYKEHYAIRIGTPNNGIVEISIDNSEFQKCRQAVGYWWFDWYNLTPGKHVLVARLVDIQKHKTLKKSEPVVCTVE